MVQRQDIDIIDSKGENYANYIDTIHRTDFDRFYDILQLTKTILEIPNMKINLRGNNVELLFREKGFTSDFDFKNLSFGTQQLMILLAIIQTRSNQIICIEEPEISLHALAQKKLFKVIQDKIEQSNSPDSQFFITTHSPIFTGIKNISTYLVTREESSKAVLIDKPSLWKLIKQHLGIENSDIYLSPYVIFVEGESEEIAIPIIANAMGYDQIGKEIRIIVFGGKDKFSKLTEFLRYINYFDTKAIVIADGHKVIDDKIIELKKGILNFKDFVREKENEFEDLFDSNSIIKAMTELSQNYKFDFNMKSQQLDELRKQKNVSTILKENLNGKWDFDKKEFAKIISSILVKEIRNNNNNRKISKVEEEIHNIMRFINQDMQNNNHI